MKKIIYIENNNQVLKYTFEINKKLVESKIDELLDKNLEQYYHEENQIIFKDNFSYSHILSSYDLISYLKRVLIEDDEIDLSEIKELMQSNNSRMRTPQTLFAISDIFEKFEYELESKTNLDNYILLINIAYRKNKISRDSNRISIAFNNREVLENLGINLEYHLKKEKQKTITL